MAERRIWRCDRCGFRMVERHCKVICPNCGQRWDCSDITIWVGDGLPAAEENIRNVVKRDRDEDGAQ